MSAFPRGRKRTTSTKPVETAKKPKSFVKHAITRLSARSVHLGMSTLCAVRSITDTALNVTLPNRVSGSISIRNISPVYTAQIDAYLEDDTVPLTDLSDMFTVGQILSAVVVKIKAKAQNRQNLIDIELSLCPTAVNERTSVDCAHSLAVSVSGQEAYGYTLDVGKDGYKGFLKTEKTLRIGDSLRGNVEKVVSNTVLMNLKDSLVETSTMNELYAGDRLKAVVSSVLPDNSLKIRFFGVFDGIIDKTHVSGQFSVGDEVIVRVLCINYKTKWIACTLLPHLLRNEPFRTETAMNSVHSTAETCQFISKNEKIGIHCTFTAGNSDENPASESLFFPAKHCPNDETPFSQLKLRILSIDRLEGTLIGSLDPKIVSETKYSVSDLKIGQQVKGTIKSLTPAGVLIKISDSLSGFCFPEHISETPIEYSTENAFLVKMIGKICNFRILNIDTRKNRVILTRKKKLVNSTLAIITDTSAALPLITHGYVASITEKGIKIGFFNGISGFIRRSSLHAAGFMEFTSSFHLGDVVRTNVYGKSNFGYLCGFPPVEKSEFAALRRQFPTEIERISAGDLILSEVVRMSPNGIVLRCNSINGFVPRTQCVARNEHGVQRSVDSLDCKVGSLVRTRVLSVDLERANVISSFLDPDTGLEDEFVKESVRILKKMSKSQISEIFRSDKKFPTAGRIVEISDDFVCVETENKKIVQCLARNLSFCVSPKLFLANAQKVNLTVLAESETFGNFGFLDFSVYFHSKSVDLSCKAAAVTFFDESVTSLDKVSEEMEIRVKVEKKDNLYLYLRVGDGISAESCQCVAHRADLSEKDFSGSAVGDYVTLRVKKIERVSKNKKSKKSKNSKSFRNSESSKKTLTKLFFSSLDVRTYDVLPVGSECTGWLSSVTFNKLYFSVTSVTHGTVNILDSSECVDVLRCFMEFFGNQVGNAFTLRVLNAENTRFSLLPQNPCDDPSGKSVLGLIVSGARSSDVQLPVQLPEDRSAVLHVAHCKNPLESYKKSQFVSVYLLGNECVSEFPESRISAISDSDLSPGNKVKCYITAVTTTAIYVSINPLINARIKRKNLSDEHLTNEQIIAQFPVRSQVTARILRRNIDENRLDLSTKQSDMLDFKYNAISDLQVGRGYFGTIKVINDVGIFVEISNSRLRGLVRKNMIADERLENPGEYYNIGDRVKVVVVKIDSKKSRVFFALKHSLVENAEFEDPEPEVLEVAEVAEISETPEIQPVDSESDSDDEFTWTQSFSSTKNELENPGKPSENTTKVTEKNPKKRSHSDKMSEIRLEERKFHELTSKTLSDTAELECTDDYERALVAEPNSSVLWIRYMTFHMELSQIEQARQIAEKALKTIYYREEGELLNVWTAYLALEVMYGSEDRVSAILTRGLSATNSKKLYVNFHAIYVNRKDTENAEKTLAAMMKKFAQSCKIYVLASEFYLTNGKNVQARAVMKRALEMLPTRKHIKFITKFALLEFRLGSAERARTILEGVISSHPKRSDVWSLYIDQEIRMGNVELVRQLFDRVVSLKMSSKKMKSFFSRYLSFEMEFGTEETAQSVKDKAVEYVKARNEM